MECLGIVYDLTKVILTRSFFSTPYYVCLNFQFAELSETEHVEVALAVKGSGYFHAADIHWSMNNVRTWLGQGTAAAAAPRRAVVLFSDW